MENNLNNNQSYFSCKTFQCFKNHNNENYRAYNITSCPFCSYDTENNLKLREKIKNEILNRRKEANIYQSKFWEYVIAILTGSLLVGYVIYYMFKLLIIN